MRRDRKPHAPRERAEKQAEQNVRRARAAAIDPEALERRIHQLERRLAALEQAVERLASIVGRLAGVRP